MSVKFTMTGTKFGNGVDFTCTKKATGAPIPANMAEIVTMDIPNGSTAYNCSFAKKSKMRENYISSFTLSGANGGPNNRVFDGPSPTGKGSLFTNCVINTSGKLPPGNPDQLSMIQQYGSKPTVSNCNFYKYY